MAGSWWSSSSHSMNLGRRDLKSINHRWLIKRGLCRPLMLPRTVAFASCSLSAAHHCSSSPNGRIPNSGLSHDLYRELCLPIFRTAGVQIIRGHAEGQNAGHFKARMSLNLSESWLKVTVMLLLFELPPLV